ncbi:MAG: peptidoglycan-associated lipoprotein Pal [Rickettsiales bacterium]|jgi:peptidoglycan-associated lipoprotein|nr:peptidoglycan-associated lipoprotein Pal [Rickettsiales bacterium]
MNGKLFLPLALLLLSGCGKSYDVVTSETQSEAGGASEKTVEAGDKVFFAFNSAALSGATKKALNLVATKLAKDKNAKPITVEGHCDERGTREYNLALGQKRANAVKKYLISKGVASKRIKTLSYGKERPAAFGKGEAVWSQNRRAVVSSN